MRGAKELVLIDKIFPQYQVKSLQAVRDAFLVIAFSFLTAICAKLKLEIGVVPITMQTFAVLLCGAFLGSQRGAMSQIVYLLGGLIGLPWFSRGGGMEYIMSPTFGYILGFVFAAYLVGLFSERGMDISIKKSLFAMLLGSIVIYIFGFLWLLKFMAFSSALSVGVYPFILGDSLKIILAGLVLPICWRFFQRSGI